MGVVITLYLLPLRATEASRGARDRLAEGLNRVGAVPSLVDPFRVAAEGSGSHLVGGLRSGVEAVGLVLTLVRSGAWAVVVRVPGGRPGERLDIRAAERARRSSGRCAVVGAEGASGAWVEPSLQLLGALEGRRSEPQQDAGRRVEAGASQREAAAELGVSQQAVHARLRGGLWNETRAVAGAVADALEGFSAGS